MVKDPTLTLLSVSSLLRLGFNPWPGNFRMPCGAKINKQVKRNKLLINAETWKNFEMCQAKEARGKRQLHLTSQKQGKQEESRVKYLKY